MTVVNSSSVFQKHPYREIVEDAAPTIAGTELYKHFQSILGNQVDENSINYSSIIKEQRYRKDRLKKILGYEKSPWARD